METWAPDSKLVSTELIGHFIGISLTDSGGVKARSPGVEDTRKMTNLPSTSKSVVDSDAVQSFRLT